MLPPSLVAPVPVHTSIVAPSMATRHRRSIAAVKDGMVDPTTIIDPPPWVFTGKIWGRFA